MNNKVFTNHSILTKEWKEFLIKTLLLISGCLVMILLAISAIIWLITLGHINLISFFGNLSEKISNKVFPE